ncbi:MAG: hypothetical protein HRU35_05995, partial [Rickettsiaceae bacterium]|nr:hypothetical protein [Rickettsiaceae bacterium]
MKFMKKNKVDMKLTKKNKITKKILTTVSGIALVTLIAQEASAVAVAQGRSVVGGFNLAGGVGLDGGGNVAFVNNSTLRFAGQYSGQIGVINNIKAIDTNNNNLIGNNNRLIVNNNVSIGSIVDLSNGAAVAGAALLGPNAAAKMQIKVINGKSLTLTGAVAAKGDFFGGGNTGIAASNYSALGKVELHHANSKLIVNNGITLYANVDNTTGNNDKGILEFAGAGTLAGDVGATNSLKEITLGDNTLQLVDGLEIKVTKITNNDAGNDYKGKLQLLGGAKIQGSIGTVAGNNGHTGLAEITLGDNTLQLVDGSDIKVTKITNNDNGADYKGTLKLLGGAKIA